MSDFQTILTEILAFRDERDWQQFHSPKNLAAALGIEVAELQETMLWKTDAEIAQQIEEPERRQLLANELADVLIYALLLCQAVAVEPSAAIRAKLAINAAKYPAELARGNARKYSDL